MEKHSVFEYWDFKDYLSKRFSTTGNARGTRIKFAAMIHASPSYVSKIVTGKIKLALEHVPVINEILQHDEAESDFFMQLVLYSQAGTKKLELYFKKNLEVILEKRRVTAEWIPDKEVLSDQVQAKYYSHWYYAMIHILTSVPNCQTKAAIAERLRLPNSIVSATLDYLIRIGLVEIKNGRYQNTMKRIYQNKDSDWIYHAHTNFRQFAIQKLLESGPDDIHFSGAAALSLKEIELLKKKIRLILKDFVAQSENTEDVYGFSMDFFRV